MLVRFVWIIAGVKIRQSEVDITVPVFDVERIVSERNEIAC